MQRNTTQRNAMQHSTRSSNVGTLRENINNEMGYEVLTEIHSAAQHASASSKEPSAVASTQVS